MVESSSTSDSKRTVKQATMASTTTTDKTAHCACGAVRVDKDGANKDANGAPLHKVTWDDVWFDGLELGDDLTLTKVFPRHFKSSHGFMGQVLHKASGTVFHIQSASADSTQRLMKDGADALYPNAKS